MDDTAAVSRRSFLAAVTGACALAALGLGDALLADDADAATGITRLPDGRVRVTVAAVPALRRVGGAALLGTVKGTPTAVVRTGANSYVALSLRCTHMGVTVKPSSTGWACPAHGSRYGRSGAVTRGPAKKPLARVRTTLAKGTLTVG